MRKLRRRIRLAGSVLALLALLAAVPALPVSGSQGDLVIIPVYEQRGYSPGEVLNLSVHVFINGESASLARPPGATIMPVLSGSARPLPLVETGRGRYDGNYTVLSADADRDGTIGILVEASAPDPTGGEPALTASEYISIYVGGTGDPPAGVAVRAQLLRSPNSPLRPGSRLTFSCCVTSGGEPLDADGIRFELRETGGIRPYINASHEPAGTGRYIVNCTIPEREANTRFLLFARVPGESYDRYTGASVELDFYAVIYHELGRNGSRVDCELLVSDREGKAVKDCSVELVVKPWEQQSPGTGVDLGRTDRKGRVKGFIDPGPDVGTVYLEGWANTSEHSQSFSGYLHLADIPEPPAPRTNDFEIHILGVEGSLGPGGSVNLTYVAFDLSAPLRDQPVDCYFITYLYNDTAQLPQGVEARRLFTDSNGTLNLRLDLPPGGDSLTSITFIGPRRPSSNTYFTYEAYDYLYSNAGESGPPGEPWANTSFSRATPGSSFRLEVTPPEGTLASARAGWRFETPPAGSPHPAWKVLNGFTWYLRPPKVPGDPFEASLRLPASIDSGLNLTVSLYLTNSSGQTTRYDLPVRVRGPVVAEPEADLCCITSIFVVNALMITLLLFNYMAARRAPRDRGLRELEVDERIDRVLQQPEGASPPLLLPLKVELVSSEDCRVCGRKIAKGNLAYCCVCGAKFHEHCSGDGRKCPSCGREWGKG